MKIDLYREPRRPSLISGPGRTPAPVTRSLPLVASTFGGRARRVHRVRSGWLYCPVEGGSLGWRMGVRTWCGQQFSSRRCEMLSDLPFGRSLCATCEGRAIGAGQPPTGRYQITHPPALYTPTGVRS